MTLHQKLMRLTNASALACAEALQLTDSFDEAVDFLRPVSRKSNSLKRGMIVTIETPCFLPSSLIGHTTKIIHKYVDPKDTVLIEGKSGELKPLRINKVFLLENNTKFQIEMKYLNSNIILEDPRSIRPATKEEKERYHLLKKQADA